MRDRAPNDYALGHHHDELQRLIGQSRWLGDLTEEVLRAAGLRPGMRVLDVGCGAGDVSFLVATLVGREGSVVGVDRAPEAIALAKRRAAEVGLANVSFITQDLQDIATGARFDAIVGRLVLMYFPEPAALLRRLLELLVPGGVMAFHELDVHGATSEPPVALLALTTARVIQALRCAHAHPRMGLRLAQAFRQAQLPTPRMIAHARVGTAAERATFEQLAGITRTLLPVMESNGIATAAEVEIDTLADRLQRAVEEADATVVAPLFVGAWAHKGGAGREKEGKLSGAA
jgi:ubiquinone/menaquinone biosynthesis C-methylase UbiE